MRVPTKAKPAGASGGPVDGRSGRATSQPDYTTSRQVLRLPDGRIVGEVVGDVLVKRVRGSVHQLRQPRGWACDVGILREAEALGARTVRIVDVETGDVYTAPLSAFWRRGFRINRGFGEQVGLLVSDFSRNGAPAAADAVQLAFAF